MKTTLKEINQVIREEIKLSEQAAPSTVTKKWEELYVDLVIDAIQDGISKATSEYASDEKDEEKQIDKEERAANAIYDSKIFDELMDEKELWNKIADFVYEKSKKIINDNKKDIEEIEEED